MKRLTLILAMAVYCMNVSAQTDTTATGRDTIRIGNILIIKKGDKKTKNSDSTIVMSRSNKKPSRVKTNWWIVDLGFSNYDDQTDYSSAGGYLVSNPAPNVPALSKSDFRLRAGKSINVNIWFFMQKLNLIKGNVNLKYGLGLELNNYRYKSNISYKENGTLPYSQLQTNDPFIFRDSISFSKNKLAADYLTVPIMLNFTTSPANSKKAIGLSLGVSGGYLYSQRNKQVSNERGKEKNKGDYDLNRFKFSYIAELGLGPVKLYGSYSPKSIYDHSLDMRPYNLGIRLGKL